MIMWTPVLRMRWPYDKLLKGVTRSAHQYYNVVWSRSSYIVIRSNYRDTTTRCSLSHTLWIKMWGESIAERYGPKLSGLTNR